MAEITLPYNYQPRPYQIPFLNAFQKKEVNDFYLIWHRKAGKDLTVWAGAVIPEAIRVPGIYYYFFPTYEQGRKALWESMTFDGVKFLDFIPPPAIKKLSDQQMMVELFNGSVIRIIGTDRFDAIRGPNPRGAVYSEYAYQNPVVREVVGPAIRINKGWSVYDTTPNGNNHGKKLWEMASSSPHWYASMLTVTDTGILCSEDIDRERENGVTEEMIQQEYYCSFEVGTLGNYYAKNIEESRAANRICAVEYDPLLPVHVVFDLGRNDDTVMIFAQFLGQEIRIIDYYVNNNEWTGYYVDVLRSAGYRYATLWIPHDGFAKKMEAKDSVAEQFMIAGYKVERVPEISKLNGINLVRKVFPRVWFDKSTCEPLISALENYAKEYDDRLKTFRQTPRHDWASHPADAMRYLAVVSSLSLMDMQDYERQHSQFLLKTTHSDQSGASNITKLDAQMDDYVRAHSDYLRRMGA